MLHRYQRPVSKDLLLFSALTLGWFAWWLYFHGHFPLSFISWAIVTSILTISALYWIDFYRPFKTARLIPDFLALWFLLPFAGMLSKYLVDLVFQATFIRDREIFVGGFLPALAAVTVEGMGQWMRTKSSSRSNVYLALTDGERETFMESVRTGRWDRYYRILSQTEFDGALATGGRVDYIIISRVATKNFIEHQSILKAQMLGVVILDYRTLINQMRGHISVHDTDIWTFLAGSVHQNTIRMIYRFLKFYLEPVAAAIGLVLLAPVFIGVAIAVKVADPGPVFFRQRRTGYLGAEFDLVKFRSMRVDAEAKGAQWAAKTDNRVTPLGRFLRKTRIDELPQLWNVVRGEMSFLGPRPERPEFYEIISKQVPAFKLRLLVRPGITGWAQLLGGYAASIEESERKLEYDLYYMQYLSPRMDLIIVWKTFLLLIRGDSGR